MMPTYIQEKELLDNAPSEWITINGVNGRKITSKTNSSKYIFLPAGGYYRDTTRHDAGSYGSYWSTTRPSGIWVLSFNSSYIRIGLTDGYLGLSIRAVIKPS